MLRKLQNKITVAYKAGNLELVAKYQQILVNSAGARALAIRHVISTKGGQTPGVDGRIIKAEEDF